VQSDFHPYSTAEPLFTGSAPSWLMDKQEQMRIMSYMLYEQIYWSVPAAFKLIERVDAKPIYIPAGKVIVETLHRHMGNDMSVICDPAIGTASEQKTALELMALFSKREALIGKFNSNRRYGIMRGDWAFMLSAEAEREEGSRVSITSVDPGALFPIYKIDEESGIEDFDVVIGWHIVEQYLDPALGEGKAFIKRTTFRKATGTGGPSPITYSVMVFEPDDWGGPAMEGDGSPLVTLIPEVSLPAPIDQLPIYVIPNFDEPGNLWGSSEMRGIERLLTAINQSISDEDMELLMTGLGVYATNAGVPVDDAGQEKGWDLGPGRVVELPGTEGVEFKRVTGVQTVEPMQGHLSYLHEQLDLSSVSPAVAKGNVEVEAAESGVALAIKYGPLISHAMEREQVVKDRMTHLFYGLARWQVAYEGSSYSAMMNVSMMPLFGPKIPENKQQSFDNVMKMLAGKVIDLATGWDMLRKLGYELPDNATLLGGIEDQLTMEADVMASRINGEVDQDVEDAPEDVE